MKPEGSGTARAIRNMRGSFTVLRRALMATGNSHALRSLRVQPFHYSLFQHCASATPTCWSLHSVCRYLTVMQ